MWQEVRLDFIRCFQVIHISFSNGRVSAREVNIPTLLMLRPSHMHDMLMSWGNAQYNYDLNLAWIPQQGHEFRVWIMTSSRLSVLVPAFSGKRKSRSEQQEEEYYSVWPSIKQLLWPFSSFIRIHVAELWRNGMSMKHECWMKDANDVQ